jgi:hypothetical protein
MTKIEETMNMNMETLDNQDKIVKDMETRFNRDYLEFFTSRKRWKSDFDSANEKIS